MPDAEHRVVYKAFADFTALYAEVAKAKAAMAALKKESGGAANVDRSKEIGQQRELNKVTREHATDVEADAKAAASQLRNTRDLTQATQRLREELAKLNTERRQATTGGTHSDSLGGAAPWTPPWERASASAADSGPTVRRAPAPRPSNRQPGKSADDAPKAGRSWSDSAEPYPWDAYFTRQSRTAARPPTGGVAENSYQQRRDASEAAYQQRRSASESAYQQRRSASETAYQQRRAGRPGPRGSGEVVDPNLVRESDAALRNHAKAQGEARGSTERSIGTSRSYQRAFRDQMGVLAQKRESLRKHGQAHDDAGRRTEAATQRSREYVRVLREIPKTPIAVISSNGVATLKDGTNWVDRMAARIRDAAREAGHFDRGFVTAGDIAKGVWAGIGNGAKAAGDRIKSGLSDAHTAGSRAMSALDGASRKTWADIGRDISGAGRKVSDFVKGLGSVRSVTSRAGNAIGDLFKFRAPPGGGGGGGGGGGSAAAAAGGASSGVSGIVSSLAEKADQATKSMSGLLGHLFSFQTLVTAAFIAAGPLVAVLGALGAAALGAGNIMGSLAGSLFALPGIFGAVATGVGALLVAMGPLANAFKAYQTYSKQATAGSRENALAQQTAARAARQAELNYTSALKSVKDAQYAARRAQMDLNSARREATRNLEDLRSELNRAGLNEETATLGVKQAMADYRKALADPNATLLDRQEALNRVKQAEFDLQDVQTKNKRNQEDYNLAQKKGVDGSDQVVAAQKAIADANAALIQSQQRVIDAELDLKKARRDQAAGGAEANTALQAYKDQLDKLSPSTRKVAEAIFGKPGDPHSGLLGGFRAIQKATSEALFAPIVSQLGKLPGLLKELGGLLTGAAGAIGRLAAKGIEMVTSGPWKADFAKIAKGNTTILTDLGNAGLSVADAFRNIIIAAQPFTTWLTGAIADVAKKFDSWTKGIRNSGGLASFLNDTKGRLKIVWDIVKNLLSFFGSMYTATKDIGNFVLDSLDKITGHWAAVGKAQEKHGSGLQTWLRNIKPLLSEIGHFIGAVVTSFAKMASDPKNINEAKRILQILAEDILPKLVDAFKQMSEHGWISKFLGAVGVALDAVSKAIQSSGGLPIDILLTFFKGIADFLKWVFEHPTVGAIFIGYATAMAALLGAAAFGKFSGLFKLWDMLIWIKNNKGALGSGLLDKIFGRTPGAGAGAAYNKEKDLPKGTAFGTYTRQLDVMIGLLEKIAECSCKAAAAAGAGALEDDLDGGAGGKKGKKGKKGKAARDAAQTAEKDAAQAAEKEGAHLAEKEGAQVAEKAAARGIGRRLGGRILGGAAAGFSFLRRVAPKGDEGYVSLPTRGASKTALVGDAEQSLIGDAEKSAARGAAEKAALGGAEKAAGGGLLRGAGKGLAAVGKGLGKGVLGLLDPLTIGGIALGGAADAGLLGKKGSTGKQLGQAGGAILSGAAIGATIGSIVPGVGTAIGGAVGAVAGAGYSLWKDKGLREKVGKWLEEIGHWFSGIGKDIGGWVNKYVVKPVVGFFVGIYNFVVGVAKGVGGWIYKNLLAPVGRFFAGIALIVFGLVSLVAKIVYDNVLTPIGHFFSAIARYVLALNNYISKWVYDKILTPIGHFFTAIYNAVSGIIGRAAQWVYDRILTPIGHFFTAIYNAAAGLVGRVASWIGNNIITPIVNFFVGIGNGVRGIVNRVAGWVKQYITDPIANFFAAIGNFITGIRKAVRNWAAEQGAPGKIILKGLDLVGFAGGGKVGGLYKGVPDTEVARLTPGEMVVRRERLQDPASQQFVEAWNAGHIDPAALLAGLNARQKTDRWMDPAPLYAGLAAATRPAGAATRVMPKVNAPAMAGHVVHDNSKHTGVTTGDITINNPVRERSDRSLRRTLHASAYMVNR